MALDFSFFKDAFEGAKSIGRGAVDFFRSPSMDAARDIGSGVASIASAFREALLNSPNKEAAKEVFSKQFVDYREDVFELGI